METCHDRSKCPYAAHIPIQPVPINPTPNEAAYIEYWGLVMHKRNASTIVIQGVIIRETAKAILLQYSPDPAYPRHHTDSWFALSQLDYIGRRTVRIDDQVYSELHVAQWLANKCDIYEDIKIGEEKPAPNPTPIDEMDDDIPF